MGKKVPPFIAHCDTPLYCIKGIGARHILIGGGGGAAKTGITNAIETFLLASDVGLNFSSAGFRSKICSKLDTDIYATMNMDVIARAVPEEGKYLVAAGHDGFCDIYESNSFTIETCDGSSEHILSLKLKLVGRFTSDNNGVDGYQKCVRFDRSSSGIRLATGGEDGHIRIWDIDRIIQKETCDPLLPIHELDEHKGAVNELDISYDGKYMISVGSEDKVYLYDFNMGRMITEIKKPLRLKNFKVRSVRFTNIVEGNLVFVAAYNEIRGVRKASKCVCYLVLWIYNLERGDYKPIIAREAANNSEAISTLCVSKCGNFTGIGTLSGSVGVFDNNDMKRIVWAKETHENFVTGVEFLDTHAMDVVIGDRKQPSLLPGPAASSRVTLLSISIDKNVQLHKVPLTQPSDTTVFLIKLSISLLFVNLLLYVLATL